MEILIENKPVDVSRLYKMADYSKKFNLPLSTVNYQMLSGKLPVVKISGIRFVIAPETKGGK